MLPNRDMVFDFALDRGRVEGELAAKDVELVSRYQSYPVVERYPEPKFPDYRSPTYGDPLAVGRSRGSSQPFAVDRGRAARLGGRMNRNRPPRRSRPRQNRPGNWSDSTEVAPRLPNLWVRMPILTTRSGSASGFPFRGPPTFSSAAARQSAIKVPTPVPNPGKPTGEGRFGTSA